MYQIIPNESAIDHMVKLMGIHYATFDGNLFTVMGALAGEAYDGGAWEVREYPNGAVAMVLPRQDLVTCISHGLMKDVELSMEALSLVANLTVLVGYQNAAYRRDDESTAERFHDLYHGLRDAVSGLMNFVITEDGIREPTDDDLLRPQCRHPESQAVYELID